MKRSNTYISAVVIVIGFLLTPSMALGQASPKEMQHFPLPPSAAIETEKSFDYVGDYLYTTASNYASPGDDSYTNDYAYFKFTDIAYKKIVVHPRFYNSHLIPPAKDGTDACPHTHLSYGMWIKYKFNPYIYGPNHTVPHVYHQFVGGGGMSGIRASDGSCQHRVDTPLASIGARFGWGLEFSTLVPTYLTYYNGQGGVFYEPVELIVGVSAPTHGWGTCKGFGCYEPVGLSVYTLH